MSDSDELEDLVSRLAERPGHAAVVALLRDLLTRHLGVEERAIELEKRAGRHGFRFDGRIDAITGRTIFEAKSDLRQEGETAAEQLGSYMGFQEEATQQRFVGLATDGADFVAYGLSDDGKPYEAERYRTDIMDPHGLLRWVARISAFGSALSPDFESIRHEFGRESIVWRQAEVALGRLWAEVKDTPDARLKYQLWQRLLGLAYGGDIDDESLFLRHTYLTILAKSIAWAALLEKRPETADEIMRDKEFASRGVRGMGGEDFFAWILRASGADDFVQRLAAQAGRFRLHDANTDIMKGLYESLIDTEERHGLGEYYTPDWLAERVCREAMDNPLEQRVLDPSCGSGTFLFHAIRRILEAGEEAGLTPNDQLAKLSNVTGIDVHPVAVTIAQVTYVLAALPAIRKMDMALQSFAVRVYLGDSLQWSVVRDGEGAQGEMFKNMPDSLRVEAPKMERETETYPPRWLTFPIGIVSQEALFHEIIDAMMDYCAKDSAAKHFRAWLQQNKLIKRFDHDTLVDTYKSLVELYAEDRDHIWGFISRNLARPVSLSDARNKADILLGNPPWVAYRVMKGEFAKTFRKECHKAGIWVGGKMASHQDLSGYFVTRACQLYLKDKGKMAFIMPYATLSRQSYEKFRKGYIREKGHVVSAFKIDRAWTMEHDLQPLFPVPSCVIFAHKAEAHLKTPRKLPKKTTRFTGTLPSRNPDTAIVPNFVTEIIEDWPKGHEAEVKSPYHATFKVGASAFPRRLILVKSAPQSGRLGTIGTMPQLEGKAGKLDKAPWKDIAPPKGQVEPRFLRSILLGSSIAPYCQIGAEKAVIPILETPASKDAPADIRLLDSTDAIKQGYSGLSNWMQQTEALWETNKSKNANKTLIQQYDYQKSLTGQFPIAKRRVVYTKSGTYPAATLVTDTDALVENGLYWVEVATKSEGDYLTAILNSETARIALEPYQSQGQFGARDIHKYILFPPWPRFKAGDSLHKDIVSASRRATKIASGVSVPESLGNLQFKTVRKRIREALADNGISLEINNLTQKLLDESK